MKNEDWKTTYIELHAEDLLPYIKDAIQEGNRYFVDSLDWHVIEHLAKEKLRVILRDSGWNFSELSQ